MTLRNVSEPAKALLKQNIYDHLGRKTEYKLGINGATPESIAKYYYDAIGRQSTKWLYPNRTYQRADSLLDYINRPPSPAPQTIDLANRAVNLLPGTVIDTTYLAYIDTLIISSGTVAGIQKMDFQYHIRGLQNCINCTSNAPLLNQVENDFFASKLEWETAGRFDTNIGRQSWRNKKDYTVKSYLHDFDGFSRLKSAVYTGNGNEDYSLANISYDANGNILNLRRKGFKGSAFGDIDSLTYTYSGNRLTKIDDAIIGNINTKDFRDSTASIDYTYWPNGSLKSDLNKKISLIEYNTYLNKPKKITFLNGAELNFNYDGNGMFISRIITDSTKWHYTPAEIYKDDSLYQISQDEGRITRKAGIYKLEFEYRDLWGNLRTAFTDSDSLPISGVYPAPVITQINDYDLLGFEHFNNQEGKNNFLFQKQERILDLDLGYDFWKYRYSDAATGRFWMVDPLGSQYAHNSLYGFQENKLGKGIELEGAELISFPLSSTSALARPITIPNTSALRIPIIPSGSTLAPMSSTQDHHYIPNEHKNHPTVKEARNEGFKQDGKENKVPLEKYSKETGDGQHGNHPNYNKHVKQKLDNYSSEASKPALKPSEFVRELVKELKSTIENNPKTKLNDLYRNQNAVAPSDNTRVNQKVSISKVNPCAEDPNCS